jgi:hypothetical protein
MARKPTPPEANKATEVTPEPLISTAQDEAEITAKVRAGLTREQAIEVITRQRLHDAAL